MCDRPHAVPLPSVIGTAAPPLSYMSPFSPPHRVFPFQRPVGPRFPLFCPPHRVSPPFSLTLPLLYSLFPMMSLFSNSSSFFTQVLFCFFFIVSQGCAFRLFNASRFFFSHQLHRPRRPFVDAGSLFIFLPLPFLLCSPPFFVVLDFRPSVQHSFFYQGPVSSCFFFFLPPSL